MGILRVSLALWFAGTFLRTLAVQRAKRLDDDGREEREVLADGGQVPVFLYPHGLALDSVLNVLYVCNVGGKNIMAIALGPYLQSSQARELGTLGDGVLVSPTDVVRTLACLWFFLQSAVICSNVYIFF